MTMSIDGDVTKKVYVNDGTSVQTTSANSSATQATSSSTLNTVFDRSNADENAKRLGLTKEEYMELLSKPEFLALKTPEEQINYIKEYKAAKQSEASVTQNVQPQTEQTEQPDTSSATSTQAPTTEATATETSSQTAETEVVVTANNTAAKTTAPEAEAAETVAATQTQATEQAEETQQTQQTTQPAATETAEPEETAQAAKTEAAEKNDAKTKQTLADKLSESFVFDSATYTTKLTPKEMLEVFVEEYAKNKFLYKDGDENSNKDVNAWRNLSDKERQDLIKEAKREVRQKFHFNEANASKNELLLSHEMTKLQTANGFLISYDEFASYPTHRQFEMIGENLDSATQIDATKLSEYEKRKLAEANSTLNALKNELKKRGVETYENISFGDISYSVKEHNIKLGVAIRDYLTEKEASGEITETEQKQLNILREKVEPEVLEKYGTRFGDTTEIEKAIANSDYAAAYADASTPIEKARILKLYTKELHQKEPEKIVDLINDAIECGNVELAFTLRSLSKNDKKLAKLLSEDIDQTAFNVNDGNIMNNYGEAVGTNITKISKTNKKGAAAANKRACQVIADGAVASYIKGLGKVENNQAIDEAIVDRTYAIKDDQEQLNVIKTINQHSNEGTKDLTAINIDRAHETIQNEGLHILVDDNGERADLIVKNGTLSRMAVSAQTEGFKTLQQSLENNLPESNAIESLKALADQIADCDASNQLEMHKSITGSKYEEVQTHAASNIHNYDKSVQAEALKATYNSGNTDAIDAANQQLDKCDPAAIQSIRAEVEAQVKAMEERQTPVTANTIAEKLVQMDAAKDPAASDEWSKDLKTAKINEYRELFMKANPATKFRMISKLQGIWQKEIISHIARYCPEMLTSLITSMGSDLFQLQLTPEIRNKIMQEMLRVPDLQADALEYFKDNPNNFSSSIKDACAELLVERKDTDIESTKLREAMHMDGLFMSAPETLGFGGKVSNREYYNKVKGDITFWKRDKYGNFIG